MGEFTWVMSWVFAGVVFCWASILWLVALMRNTRPRPMRIVMTVKMDALRSVFLAVKFSTCPGGTCSGPQFILAQYEGTGVLARVMGSPCVMPRSL